MLRSLVKPARDKRSVSNSADAERDINSFGDKIQHLISRDRLEGDGRVAVEKRRQHWY